MSRAGDIPEGPWICLSHRNLILGEDKRCSMFLQFLAHAQTFDRGVPARVSQFSLSQAPRGFAPFLTRSSYSERKNVISKREFWLRASFVDLVNNKSYELSSGFCNFPGKQQHSNVTNGKLVYCSRGEPIFFWTKLT